MLSSLATLGAQLIAAVAWILVWVGAVPQTVHRVAATFLAVAFVSGLVTLGLTAIALRVRHQRPPRSLTFAALAVSLTPLAICLVWFVSAARP